YVCFSLRLLVFVTHSFLSFFFFIDPATTEIYTLSLHDALPIWLNIALIILLSMVVVNTLRRQFGGFIVNTANPNELNSINELIRSEEHTSELQSRFDLVCRLLLEKKKKIIKQTFDNIDTKRTRI